MNKRSKFNAIITGVLVASATIVPARAQAIYPRVAVGPLNSTARTYVSISAAQHYCRVNNGCRVTAGVEVGPDLWTNNNHINFPGATRFIEPETGYPVLLVGAGTQLRLQPATCSQQGQRSRPPLVGNVPVHHAPAPCGSLH